MTVELPLENRTWPLFRVLTKESWDGTNQSGSGWTVQPMKRRNIRQHGMYLIDMERCCLPMIGRARIGFRFGNFDDALVGSSRTTNEPWDSDSEALDLPNLAGHEIRIQAAPRPTDDSTPAWRTVWWGYCEYQEDSGWPAAAIPSGERIYHCVEAIARLQRWQMDRHGFTVNGALFSNLYGNPGYNVAHKRDGLKLGNRSPSQYETDDNVQVYFHTKPGAGSTWTDEQAINHALSASRPGGEPLFVLAGTTSLLSGVNAWEIKEGATVLDFLVNACRRERGRGVVFADWADDSGAPEGPLTITLNVYPQQYFTTSYTDPSTGTPGFITGAAGAVPDSTAVDVDLIGDHRVVESAFHLGSPDQYRYDYLETLGEPIEVLATLAYFDGYESSSGRGVAIERRWGTAEQSTFEALSTAVKRAEERYKPVYQLHGLRRDWRGLAGDGNNGNNVRVDYRCGDDGYIDVPTSTDPSDTSPLLVDVLSDLPIFVGYTYSASVPARADAQTETGDPQRREPLILLRKGSNLFLKSEQTAKEATAKVDSDGIWITVPSDNSDSGASRYISKTSGVSPSLSAGYNLQDLSITVGLRLPHRVRMASYATGKDATNAKRRAVIYHPNMHLWLASPGAIWDLDMSTGTVAAGFAPKRGASSASSTVPGTLRDDRSGLAQLHALASAWYLQERRTVEWTIRDCGFLENFTVGTGENASTVDYPTLGQVVHEMSANGQAHTVNTPIVRVYYDNTSGTTQWETGWSSLDFAG